jgi:SAM-dependent methyltransferase
MCKFRVSQTKFSNSHKTIYSPFVPHLAKRVKKLFHKHEGVKYTLWKCLKTGIVFWYPRKIDKQFYSDDPFLFQKQSHWDSFEPAPWTDFVFDEDFIVPFINNKTVLDVGCGNGVFLHKLATKKIEGFGIDLDPNAVIAARKMLGRDVKIENLSLSQFISDPRNHNRFDVITIFEVLEHQDEPNDFLNQLKILLKNDGYIVGSIPNTNRIIARLGLREPYDNPPNHFFWFNIDSIKLLFSYNGLEVVNVCPAIKKLKIENIRYSILSGLFGERYLSIMKVISSYFNRKYKKVKQTDRESSNFTKRLIKNLFTIPFVFFLPMGNFFNNRLSTTIHLGFIAKKK